MVVSTTSHGIACTYRKNIYKFCDYLAPIMGKISFAYNCNKAVTVYYINKTA